MIDPLDYSPWDFWTSADDDARTRQQQHLGVLAARPRHELGDAVFVSELASVDADELRLGDRSYVAAGAYLTGTLDVGADCSLNPYTVVRGTVGLGDGVRVGAHSSILGFNHTMDDPDTPVFRQPLVSRGIVIGDDVWIGSHVVVLDGVTVGARAVLAAGAVVTRDVPAGAVVGGNPARLLRWRVPPAPGPGTRDPLAERLRRLGETARSQVGAVLARSWSDDDRLFRDRPGVAPTVRAQGDAIELADLLLGTAPPHLPADEQVARLRGWQDAATGLVGTLTPEGSIAPPAADDPDVAYHVLSTGYALDLLGSSFAHPVSLVTESSAAEVARRVAELPWEGRSWHAGHWVDAFGTALLWTRRRGDAVPDGYAEALVGSLLLRADPTTGMWGSPAPDDGLLQIVNGFYRASRGTFAQFGLPLPHPERIVDTVLRHARDERFFRPDRQDACNVLDVAHPLWLTRSTGYRSDEVVALARRLLDDAVARWVDGEGFAFRAGGADADGLPGTVPGLQGTEMWLATIWYLADLCGLADALGYRPRGVHRPEQASAHPSIPNLSEVQIP